MVCIGIIRTDDGDGCHGLIRSYPFLGQLKALLFGMHVTLMRGNEGWGMFAQLFYCEGRE